MAGTTLTIKTGGTVIGTMLVSEGLWCNENEEYKTSPLVVGGQEGDNVYGGHVVDTFQSITPYTGGIRGAGYIVRDGYNGDYINFSTGYGDYYSVSDSDGIHSSNVPFGIRGYSIDGFTSFSGTISTNVPIFENLSDAQGYIRAVTDTEAFQYLKLAINYKSGVVFNDETNEFYVNERYNEYTVTKGIKSEPGQATYIRAERILYNGNAICFYRGSSNKFELTLVTGSDLLASKYSNSSFQELLNVPYEDFSFETLEYSGPFYSPYDSNLEVPDYEGYLATVWSTNIPIFGDYTKAQQYLNGELDATDAENWDKISGDPAYGNIIDNLTEQPEQQTEFGEVYIRNIFSQLYLCNSAALYEISNNLFDYDVTTLSGIWEDIKKGLEMYGSNPMECVQGLRFYPFDLTSIFTQTQSQNYVYFGAYQLQLQNSSVYKMIYANGYKDLGSVTIKRTFKDWRDFEPYTKLSIYLPYVGRFQLDLHKYYDKTVNIRYYLDVRTGACCACLIANGVLLDWFDGLIGTEMPITLTDYSSYAQNQINIIMRNAGMGTVGEAAFGNVANKVISAKTAGDTLDAAVATREAGAFASLESQTAGAGIASGAMGAVGMGAGIAGIAAMTIMKTQFDLLKDGTAGYTKGRPGSSAMINNFLPQYPTFMFEIMEIDESPYLNDLYGRPSNASGRIGDFSGYLEAEDVMLICPIATDNERQEIIDLVRSGIYI